MWRLLPHHLRARFLLCLSGAEWTQLLGQLSLVPALSHSLQSSESRLIFKREVLYNLYTESETVD